MKNISLKVNTYEAAALERLAREKGMSKSAVVREAMAEYMTGQGEATKTSVYDEMAEYIGCVDGPSDLSTNPKYMEDFGL